MALRDNQKVVYTSPLKVKEGSIPFVPSAVSTPICDKVVKHQKVAGGGFTVMSNDDYMVLVVLRLDYDSRQRIASRSVCIASVCT